MYSIAFIFLVFFFYSFLGYIIEISCVYLSTKKFTFSRGYLIGPYLPIFGTGAITIIYALEKYQGDFFALFIYGFVLSGVLEYITSYIMEKLYGLRWWDYSNNKYNIAGRVCLSNLFFFGIFGVLIVEYINPLLIKLFSLLNNNILIIIALILFLIMLIDFMFSATTANDIKIKLKNNRNKFIDSTEQIKAIIREKLNGFGFKDYRYKNFNFRTRRLINAFPYIKNKLITASKKRKNWFK